MSIQGCTSACGGQPVGGAAPPAAEGRPTDIEAPVLPDPMMDLLACGDPYEKIAALMTRSFRQDRRQARESAQLEERNIMAEGRKRVKAMRDEADKIRHEAYAKGATKIASGALQMEGQLQLGRDPHATDLYLTPQQYEGIAKGCSDCTVGVGDIVAGGYEGDQRDLSADAIEHESLAEAAKRREQEYRDQVDDARAALDKIADFLREVQSAQNGASQAAILRA